MANRNMQAKALKLKRQKRLFPRHYAADYIPVGRSTEGNVLQREARDRVKSLAFDDEYMKYLETKQRFHGVPAGRHEVLQHLNRIEMAVDDALKFVVIAKTNDVECQLFYNSDRTVFVLLEVEFTTGVTRSSMRYMDRMRCLDAYKRNEVRWVHYAPLCPPVSKE